MNRLWHLWLSVGSLWLGICWQAAADEAQREYRGQHADKPPRIDGRLTESVWETATPTQGMTQTFPNDGSPASFQTEIRLLYDKENLYIGAHCQDADPKQIVARITRRDRWIESDWFSVEIDSRHDRRSGFFFSVNAAGVKQDGILFDENQFSESWDGQWDAECQLVEDGWDVEMRIPLHLLRFESGPDVQFGVNFIRRISRLNENDQWQYIPPDSSMRVSRFGVLKNLDIVSKPLRMEVVPYAVARQEMHTGQDATQTIRPVDLGVDARASLGSNFMLTVTANPDFGQVEADQMVLNLTNYETYYPEKRPFFLEDMALFQTPMFGDGGPRAQLFYTRRVGRSPREVDLNGDEEVIQPAAIPRIYGAAKLAGQTSERFSLGLIQAVTSDEETLVRGEAGEELSRISEPLTSFSILRIKQEFLKNSSAGMMATSTVSPHQGSAFTGGTDLQLELFDGSYNLTALTFFSYLTKDRFAWQDDFTQAGLDEVGPFGFGGELLLQKKSGENWVGAVGGNYRSLSLTLNDVGYLDRPDQIFMFGWGQYRQMQPIGPLARIQINVNAWLQKNSNWINLGDGANINGGVTFKNNWILWGYLEYMPGGCDDRETQSGRGVAVCSTHGRFGGDLYVQTDQNSWISVASDLYFHNTEKGYGLIWMIPITFTPISKLQLELTPSYRWLDGSIRWIDTLPTEQGDQYLFARQHVESWSILFRGTFTFTPRFTLQGYAQVLLSSVDHGEKLTPREFGQSTIFFNDMRPALGVPDDYDYFASDLIVSAVLRWEYLPGSVAYLVYTGSITDSEDWAEFRFGDSFRNIFRADSQHVFLLKISYLWG